MTKALSSPALAVVGLPAPGRDTTEIDDTYLPARQVWERYGVTSMTLHRWLRDGRMAFPAPVYLGRFRYWRLSTLLAWERERAAAGAPR